MQPELLGLAELAERAHPHQLLARGRRRHYLAPPAVRAVLVQPSGRPAGALEHRLDAAANVLRQLPKKALSSSSRGRIAARASVETRPTSATTTPLPPKPSLADPWPPTRRRPPAKRWSAPTWVADVQAVRPTARHPCAARHTARGRPRLDAIDRGRSGDCISSAHRQAPSTAPVSASAAVPGNVDLPPRRRATCPILAGSSLWRSATRSSASSSTAPMRDGWRRPRAHGTTGGAALAERHFGVGAGGEHAVSRCSRSVRASAARSSTTYAGAQRLALRRLLVRRRRLRPPRAAPGADGFACVCGNHGCLSYASAAGLVRHWRAKGGDAAGFR